MAAIIGLEDGIIEDVCKSITDEVVVPANYNCPGQLVISGSMAGIEKACAILKEKGAKRALPLKVGGAFHSPLMESARQELAEGINNTSFDTPICPVYQNVDALPHSNPEEIKQNLVKQLTSSVLWTKIVQNMGKDGANEFIEVGPGTALQGMIKKTLEGVTLSSASI